MRGRVGGRTARASSRRSDGDQVTYGVLAPDGTFRARRDVPGSTMGARARVASRTDGARLQCSPEATTFAVRAAGPPTLFAVLDGAPTAGLDRTDITVPDRSTSRGATDGTAVVPHGDPGRRPRTRPARPHRTPTGVRDVLGTYDGPSRTIPTRCSYFPAASFADAGARRLADRRSGSPATRGRPARPGSSTPRQRTSERLDGSRPSAGSRPSTMTSPRARRDERPRRDRPGHPGRLGRRR